MIQVWVSSRSKDAWTIHQKSIYPVRKIQLVETSKPKICFTGAGEGGYAWGKSKGHYELDWVYKGAIKEEWESSLLDHQ